MPQLNGTGPEGRGSKSGRGLGLCKDTKDKGASTKLGKGLGLKKRSGEGRGKGRRLKSGIKEL